MTLSTVIVHETKGLKWTYSKHLLTLTNSNYDSNDWHRLCISAIRSRSYSCVEHDCRLDIFYTREKEDLIHSDTALAVPGSVYLLVEGTMMLCIRIDIRTLSESDIPTDSDKQVLNHGGSHTVVYNGTTSDTEPKGTVILAWIWCPGVVWLYCTTAFLVEYLFYSHQDDRVKEYTNIRSNSLALL